MKMKSLKKAVCIALAGAMTIAGMTGCGNSSSKSQGGEKVIEIRLWENGNGTEYVKKMIEAFEQENPDYTCKLVTSVESQTPGFGLPEADTVDLYIGVLNTQTKYLEPLDDILEYTVPGESMKIGEKFSENYLSAEVFSDGHYYNLAPCDGVPGTGFVYNKELFEDAGITQLPRTSDELAVVCDTLMEADITPLCSFKNGGYWSYIGEAWFLQYDGWDYYRNTFYACVDEDGTSPSIEVFKTKDGRYKTLKALEKIVTPDYLLAGSNSADHTTIQTRFLNGEAAMMMNGGWLENEMASVGSVDNFAMMKMPVISSITEKLNTVKTEAELRQLISAVDAVAAGEKKIDEYKQGENYVVNGKEVSAFDWEYVNLARHTSGSSAVGGAMYIPNYSDAIEGAKEFMKFYYSEKGAQILADVFNCKSMFATEATTVDESTQSSFIKSAIAVNDMVLQSGSQYMKNQHEIFIYGGAISYGTHISPYLQYYSAANPNDRINADEAWNQLIDYVDSNYENTWLANIK